MSLGWKVITGIGHLLATTEECFDKSSHINFAKLKMELLVVSKPYFVILPMHVALKVLAYM